MPGDKPRPLQPLQPSERVRLVDLGDYLLSRSLEIAAVTLNSRQSIMVVVVQTRPRGMGGAVKVVQIG